MRAGGPPGLPADPPARPAAMPPAAMQVTVNGQARQVTGPQSMEALLAELKVQTHAGLAVLLNGDVVRRADWAQTTVQAADTLEIVRATVGG
jgi:sulfur carrier protein